MRDANGWFSRFHPSDAALTACKEVVDAWKQKHGFHTNLEEPTWKLAARVKSWIGPKSVSAGVGDVIGGLLGHERVPEGALEQLGEQLTRRLLADGLLGQRTDIKAAAPAQAIEFGPGTRA